MYYLYINNFLRKEPSVSTFLCSLTMSRRCLLLHPLYHMGAKKAQTSKPLNSDPEKLFVKMIRHKKENLKY